MTSETSYSLSFFFHHSHPLPHITASLYPPTPITIDPLNPINHIYIYIYIYNLKQPKFQIGIPLHMSTLL